MGTSGQPTPAQQSKFVKLSRPMPEPPADNTLSNLLRNKREVSPQAQQKPPVLQPETPKPPKSDSKTPNQKQAFGWWPVPVLTLLLLIIGSNWKAQTSQTQSSWRNYEPILNQNLSTDFEKGLRLQFDNQITINMPAGIPVNPNQDWAYSFDAKGKTANHFPGAPYLMHLGKKLFSDTGFLTDLVASALLALALALLVNRVRNLFGWLAAFFALATILSDASIFRTTFFQADTIVVALITLAFVIFNLGVKSHRESSRNVWAWPVAGTLLGVTTLFQFQTNLWLPILLAIWIIAYAIQILRKQRLGLPLEAFALFWIGVIIVSAPWWIRNCQTTESLKPLGFAVTTNLDAAYCDESIELDGNLDLDGMFQRREQVFMNMFADNAALIEKEAIFAKQSKSAATSWAKENPSKIPALMGQRVASHLGISDLTYFSPQPETFAALIILIGALIGCLATWKSWGGDVMCLVATSIFVVAITWSDHGRLLVPLKGLIDATFGIGIAFVVHRFILNRSKRKSREPLQASEN